MPITVRTISVMRSVRRLMARLALGGLFDRFFERLRVGQRAPFVLLQSAAGLADQERRRAREAVVVRGLLVGGDFGFVLGVAALGLPLGEVEPRDLLGEVLQERFGDVAAVLLALRVVEELDVVPGLLLRAGSVGRFLLGVEDFRFARRRLEAEVFDLHLAFLDRAGDQLRKRAGFLGEFAADRALQVAEVLDRDRRVGVADRASVLRYAGELLVDFLGEVVDLGRRRRGFFGAAPARGDQDHDDRDDHDHRDTRELRDPFALGGIRRGRGLRGFAIFARLLAALLSGQILLVDRRHRENFYRFPIKRV